MCIVTIVSKLELYTPPPLHTSTFSHIFTPTLIIGWEHGPDMGQRQWADGGG